jgi:hypothetical protein
MTPAAGGNTQAWLAWLVPGRALSDEMLARVDWNDVVQSARTHHVAAALHSRLAAGGWLVHVETGAREPLLRQHQAATFDSLIWRRALGLVLPALAAEGIVATPYKGAALAFGVYEDPVSRSMSDIDLWLDAADIAPACAVLERLGFRPREKADRPRALQATYDGELPYVGHEIGVPLVELHWGVFPGEWLRRASRVDRDSLGRRRRAGTLAGAPVRLLAPEDHLIQVAVHAGITHVFSMATVRCLLDLVTLAHRGIDWDIVVERAREWRLARVVGHALALGGDIFDEDSLRIAASRLLTSRERAALYRFVDPAAVLRQDALTGARKWRYLLAVVDRPADRVTLISRSAWPEREWLAARYGRTGWSVRAAHLAGALRGRF